MLQGQENFAKDEAKEARISGIGKPAARKYGVKFTSLAAFSRR
jgi:hypothetical protein